MCGFMKPADLILWEEPTWRRSPLSRSITSSLHGI